MGRPVIALRFGAAVELDDLASEATGIVIGRHATRGRGALDSQSALATLFDEQTKNAGGRLISAWLHKCYDEGKFGDLELIRAPADRTLRGSTYLGADTPAETLRTARLQGLDLVFVFSLRGVPATGTGARPTVSTAIRVVEAAGGRELRTLKPKTVVGQVRKDVEALLGTMNKDVGLEELPAQLDIEAVQVRVKALAGRKTENPLPLLAELGYYQREKRIPEETVVSLMSSLIGEDDAKVIIGGSDVEREQLVRKWLPKQGL